MVYVSNACQFNNNIDGVFHFLTKIGRRLANGREGVDERERSFSREFYSAAVNEFL